MNATLAIAASSYVAEKTYGEFIPISDRLGVKLIELLTSYSDKRSVIPVFKYNWLSESPIEMLGYDAVLKDIDDLGNLHLFAMNSVKSYNSCADFLEEYDVAVVRKVLAVYAEFIALFNSKNAVCICDFHFTTQSINNEEYISVVNANGDRCNGTASIIIPAYVGEMQPANMNEVLLKIIGNELNVKWSNMRDTAKISCFKYDQNLTMTYGDVSKRDSLVIGFKDLCYN